MSKRPHPAAEPEDPVASAILPRSLEDATTQAIEHFTGERDDLLARMPPESLLPQTEEAFYARDPFSADYADFLKDKSEIRREKIASVNQDLRASLLRSPHLMEKPEESAHRGAAAVWRSLREQLRNEGLEVLDGSDLHEIEALRRDLVARKQIIEALGKGLDGLLKRVDQRLKELEHQSPAGLTGE